MNGLSSLENNHWLLFVTWLDNKGQGQNLIQVCYGKGIYVDAGALKVAQW